MIPTRMKPLAMLLLAGTAISCMQARAADMQVAMADTAALPSCGAANFDATRNLYTVAGAAQMVSPRSGEPVSTKGKLVSAKDLPVNQQCVLRVAPTASAGPNELTPGRYTVYYSGGGDGGAGGSLRYNGGGGGGAGAAQRRETVVLTPGTYKLTIGGGGPGGTACKDPLLGGPGYPGAPTSLVSLNDGRTLVGAPGADAWKRPTRRELEKMKGNIDGHGGSGPGKSPGGNGGFNVAGRAFGATDGGDSKVAWTDSKPGDNGTGEQPKIAEGISAGGGGGAGLGDGGKGAGLDAARPTQTREFIGQMGGLGAGGGGGQGEQTFCTAGAPGGPGYMAFRKG